MCSERRLTMIVLHIPLLLLVAGQCAQAGKFIPVSPQQDSRSGKHLHRYITNQCSESGSFWATRVWIRILPFSREGIERTGKMLAKLILIQNFFAKNYILIIKRSFKILMF
jgi:hypothetical protein